MGIERPSGPHALEMTAGAAWPAADEDAYRRRADELDTTLRSLTIAREEWNRHRNALFGGDAVWSGRAASAATAEIDSRTRAMQTLEEQLRVAADQARRTASAISDTKTDVTERVHMAQQVIAEAEALDLDGIDSFVNNVVVTTYGANTELNATAATRLAGPSAAKADLPDGGLRTFGPTKEDKTPAPDNQKLEPPPSGPVTALTDPSGTRWQGPPPAGASDQTGFWAVDTNRPMDNPTPIPAPAPYRSAPPPCSTLEGPTTGVITTKMGKSPQAEEGVGLDLKNTYKFRIAGTQFTGQTQMVQRDGKWYQAQWQSYTYEMNKVPVLSGTGDLGAIQLPYFNEFNHWTPVTWGQIMQENAQYPGDTFTIPNAFGVPISVVGGVPIITTPTVPIMTNGG